MNFYSDKEKETLKEFFQTEGWKTFIRPYEEHVRKLTKVIIDDEDLDDTQRKNFIKTCKVYKEVVEAPLRITDMESKSELPSYDPYE